MNNLSILGSPRTLFCSLAQDDIYASFYLCLGRSHVYEVPICTKLNLIFSCDSGRKPSGDQGGRIINTWKGMCTKSSPKFKEYQARKQGNNSEIGRQEDDTAL